MMYEYEKRKFRKYLGVNLYNTLKSYNCIVAGGSILSIFSNTEINDIDVYFRCKEDLSQFMHSEMEGQWIIAYTKKAFLFKVGDVKVQTIYFQYFDNANDLFNTFDFTVCMGAFDFKTEEFVLHDDFLRNNVSRILKFNSNTAYPIVSALRVDKYKRKGYQISKTEFLKIMLTIMNLKIDNYEDLKEQMGGMYGENYDTLLKPIDGKEFDISKVISDISKIGETDYDFKLSNSGEEIEDFDAFVCKTLGLKIKCFEYDGKFYCLKNSNIEEIENDFDKELYEISDMEQIVRFPITRYKYVKQLEDGTLRSFYDRNFEWKIGVNVPENESCGLYAVTGNELENCSYSSESNRVCIEAICECFEDIILGDGWCSSENTYKKLTVVRIVPKDEVIKMIGIEESEENQCK